MTANINELVTALVTIEHGYTQELAAAKKIFEEQPDSCFSIAHTLLKHTAYQARMLGVFLLGFISSEDPKVVGILKEHVSADTNWRVQEILAMAFDQYCKDRGYESALPVIKEWLSDKRPNVCRAVTEGLRNWVKRPFFCDHPQKAIDLISQHKASDSEYLRKSVGNALKDIAKVHPTLVKKELDSWDKRNGLIAFTYRYAAKWLDDRAIARFQTKSLF